MFIHLHNHSHYSILEGLPKPADYVKKAAELGMQSVAITDTMGIYGCQEFYEAAKGAGINPILGAEIIVGSEKNLEINNKLVFLAKNIAGYRNILEILSTINLNPDKENILVEDLKTYFNDLFVLSGTISGEIPYLILSGEKDEVIYEKIQYYQNLFGKENYFLELLHHEDIPKQSLVTKRLIDIGTKYNIPLVATNNCFYVEKNDKDSQDVIQALGTGYQIDMIDRPSLKYGDYSFLTEEEMTAIFGYIPQALENTYEIAKKVNIEIELGKILIPVYKLNDEQENDFDEINKTIKKEGLKQISDNEWFLRRLCYEGMNSRFGINFSDEEIDEFIKKKDIKLPDKQLSEFTVEELRNCSKLYFTDKKLELLKNYDDETVEKILRLEYELFVVNKMGFDTYFLIVYDYINWAKNNGVPVGPGRGSAAGALLAYLIGITDLNPMQFDLIFERFLNPARVSMPDIDTDFADTGRDRVIDYCRERYGSDHVAQICTFGTFAARAAIKDVARVRGMSFSEANELAKLVPEKPGTKLTKALESSPEMKELYDNDPKYKQIIDDALKIEGNVRQIGVHACAVIIAPEKITNYTALQHPPKDAKTIITQYSGHPLEDLGLLKMDFLGLRNLTIIQRTAKIVKNNKNIDIEIGKIPLDDPKVFKIFARGDTIGVFQFESDGMKTWLRSLKPTCFDDIIAMVALYRPGPMQFIEPYIKRKYGEEKVDYMFEDLEKFLLEKYGQETVDDERRKLFEDLNPFMEATYGIAIYQEQLMRLVQAMAGFSLAEADLLRRGVGKKKKDVIEKLKIEFIARAKEFHGYKEETASTIYEKMIMPAADYSFNKSHAACYAYVAYQTAYLKTYFRTEFLTSVMVTDEEDLDRIAIEVGEALNHSINILPPSINESLKHFTYIDDKNIRFGLKAIKGLGNGPIDRIISEREKLETKKFTSLEEFVKCVGKEVINKKSLESIVKSGSLDCLENRGLLFDNIQVVLDFAKELDKQANSVQIGLFDADGEFAENIKLVKGKGLNYEDKLFFEKEVMGFMVSGHPLDGLSKYCTKRAINDGIFKTPISELKSKYEKCPTDEKKEKYLSSLKSKKIKVVGLITDMRKILTKSGKNMAFLTCEGFDYDFEVSIFDRVFNENKDKIAIGRIVVVEGFINIDFNYARKSISGKTLNVYTLTEIRKQAKELNLFDKLKRPIKLDDNRQANLDKNEMSKNEKNDNFGGENLEENTSENNEIVKYVVKIPSHAKKEDLIELKNFLQNQKSGNIEVFIDLRGNLISTKISIENLENLKNWEEKMGYK